MRNLYFILLSSIIFTSSLAAQNDYSVQLSYGMTQYSNSFNGLIGLMQLNYKLNPTLTFYVQSGFLTWNEYETHYESYEKKNSEYKSVLKKLRIADDHNMIPLNLGVRILVQESKILNFHITGELGYSYLKFNKYNITSIPIPLETPDNLFDNSIYYDYQSSLGSTETENLFGLGIGIGVSRDIGKSIDILIEYKINTIANNNFSSIFGARGTYRSWTAGLSYNI